jgi:hypothetical protein
MYCDQNGQEKVQKDLANNKKTVVSWCLRIREDIAYHIATEGNVIGGVDENENPLDIEINEFLFCKIKYNRGRVENQNGFFSGIERNSGKCFFCSGDQ